MSINNAINKVRTNTPCFSAYISTNIEVLSDPIFDYALINNTSSYNPSNGEFSTPSDGNYVIGYNILFDAGMGQENVGFYISIGGVPFNTIIIPWHRRINGFYGVHPYYITLNQTNIYTLSAGDIVKVVSATYEIGRYYIAPYSYFYGYKII